jgi:biotin synthase-related radical SAM superfamily protein
VHAVRQFGLPIGVSIYPTPESPKLLASEGITEVKWNIEAATPELFVRMCPHLDLERIWNVLRDSVDLFGENRVFSNVIVGLGETDGEIETCLSALTSIGVIPVLRPLTPCGELSGYPRPSAERLLRLLVLHQNALRAAGLDTRKAVTMCTACTGCDLVPGRDT